MIGTAHAKPLVIAEWGTGEDADVTGRKTGLDPCAGNDDQGLAGGQGGVDLRHRRSPNCPRYSNTARRPSGRTSHGRRPLLQPDLTTHRSRTGRVHVLLLLSVADHLHSAH